MLHKMWAGITRQLRLLAVFATVTVLGGTGWSYLTGGADDETLIAETPAWGDETLAGIHGHLLAGLPIRVANACGLGASSCFRCHNGKRAAAPGTDSATDPWHVQHKTVNNSCAGCHQGNPRLMKEDIAHKGMLADPRTSPGEACFGCHTSDDAQSLVDAYQKLTGE
ncbi:MAG: hypothetical protein J5I92_01025 [Thiogranum sp.]|nr:hypothetical protein [Thiogranum sp.]